MAWIRDMTLDECNEFWDKFSKRHPDVYEQLPPNTAFVNGQIFCNQPAKMPNDEYKIFERYLWRWYGEHGIMEMRPDFVYVLTEDEKGMEIDTSHIDKIEPATEPNMTKVTFKVKDTEIKLFVVIKEDIEYFKRRVYIF